jgi:hypothetical protein
MPEFCLSNNITASANVPLVMKLIDAVVDVLVWKFPIILISMIILHAIESFWLLARSEEKFWEQTSYKMIKMVPDCTTAFVNISSSFSSTSL